MIAISGYQTNEQLYKSAHSIIYRGRREADDRPVIRKTLNPEYLTPERIAHLRREYDMTRRFL
jgi:hypothetical protein